MGKNKKENHLKTQIQNYAQLNFNRSYRHHLQSLWSGKIFVR